MAGFTTRQIMHVSEASASLATAQKTAKAISSDKMFTAKVQEPMLVEWGFHYL